MRQRIDNLFFTLSVVIPWIGRADALLTVSNHHLRTTYVSLVSDWNHSRNHSNPARIQTARFYEQ